MNGADIKTDSDQNRVSEEYHPSYSSPSAGVVVLSEDGVKFRVHSSILATSSKFFDDMFGMPRQTGESHDDALPMGESSETLQTLLVIIYPRDTNPVLPSLSYAFVRNLLSATEKYDLARVNHYVQLLTKTEPFLSRPLKVYALACTFGWAEDADKLSEQTLDLDLSSPYYAEVLKSIDSTFLYKLFQLRWGIKAEVVDGIRLTADMSYDDCYGCKPNCTSSETPAEEEWECLELLIRGELDRCPDGSSLRQSKFWSQVGLARLWNLRCNECGERAVRKSSVKERSLWRLDEAEPFTKK